MSHTPPYLHKQTLDHIARAGLKIVIWPDKKVEILPTNESEKRLDEVEEVRFD